MLQSKSLVSYLIIVLFSIGLCVFSLCLGGANITWHDILNFGFGENIGEMKEMILLEIRLPRVIMAFLIGMLLASSGVVVQSVFLNPLADPYIIGIAASATFGAVVAYLLKLPDFYYGIFAFISSSVLSLVIFNLAKKGRSIATLLIIGIAFSSFLGAFTSFATYLIGEDSFKITAWMMGYIGGANWDKIAYIALPLVLCIFYFYLKRHELNVLLSGDEEAQSLGVDVEKTKKRLLIASSLAVAFSVAFTGMIGFVGLIIPHTLRMLLRTSNNAVLIPVSTLAGGLFLLACDTIAKSVLAPVEIPIGVITAFFGAPFFLFLAIKSGRSVV
ncbi:MAG: iron ABC transporter permease [Campylobacter sp.]|nr:iron ABC transporter permease [Campylobacter sp.]